RDVAARSAVFLHAYRVRVAVARAARDHFAGRRLVVDRQRAADAAGGGDIRPAPRPAGRDRGMERADFQRAAVDRAVGGLGDRPRRRRGVVTYWWVAAISAAARRPLSTAPFI